MTVACTFVLMSPLFPSGNFLSKLSCLVPSFTLIVLIYWVSIRVTAIVVVVVIIFIYLFPFKRQKSISEWSKKDPGVEWNSWDQAAARRPRHVLRLVHQIYTQHVRPEDRERVCYEYKQSVWSYEWVLPLALSRSPFSSKGAQCVLCLTLSSAHTNCCLLCIRCLPRPLADPYKATCRFIDSMLVCMLSMS